MRIDQVWTSVLVLSVMACQPSENVPRPEDASEADQPVEDAGMQVAHPPEVSTYPELGGKLAPVLESIASARALLRQDSGTLAADSAFLRFRRELRDRIREVVKEFNEGDFQADVWPAGAAAMMRWREEQRPERQATSEEEARADSLLEVLEAHGLWADRAEGDTYFSGNEAFLLERLGPYLTPGMREFLDMQAEEQRRPTAEDAALMIPPDELARRIRRSEQFRSDHRESLVWDVVDSRYQWYLNHYLGGLPNSPAFQWGTGDLDPELRKSFERYVAEHGITPSGRLVAHYLTMLEASNFQRSAAIDSLLAQRRANLRLRPFP